MIARALCYCTLRNVVIEAKTEIDFWWIYTPLAKVNHGNIG